MREIDLENVVPGLAHARTRERLNRAAAFAGVPWTVCGFTCVHMTPRHRLELQIAGNAFATNRTPEMGDVFQLLWRVSPYFSRRPGIVARWRRWRMASILKKTALPNAIREVCEYIVGMLQDMPEGGTSDNGVKAAEYVIWIASDAHQFAAIMGMTLEEYMDTPYLVLQQLLRAHRSCHEEDPNFIDASDRIAQQWVQDRAKELHAN